ncbi:MAG: hypothetical protein RLZZ574_288 [Cyanobacteriota bacterium]|jgi:hypothetical protein
MNGQAISYQEEEEIAVVALLNVAKTYCENGHNVVFVSDFRLNSLDLVMRSIGLSSPVIKLIASDTNILRKRVLNPSRPSTYRDVDEALHINQKIFSTTFENQLALDVTKCTFKTEIALVWEFIIAHQNI